MRDQDWTGIARRRVREFPIRLFFSVGIAAAIYLLGGGIWPFVWLTATVLAQLATIWVSAPMRRDGFAPGPWRKRLFTASVVLSTTIFACMAPMAWFLEGWQGRVLAVTVLAGGVMNVRLHASSSAAMLWTGAAPFALLLVTLPVISLLTEPAKPATAFICLASFMFVAHLGAATRRGLLDTQAVAASLDLAERTSEDLKRVAAEADAANQAKSEFLANMSHEIRTPLNGVMGVAGALAGTELTVSQKEMVKLIEGSARTLETLLSDILDLARVEAGKLSLRAEVFDPADAAGACGALFEAAAQAKGLDLQVVIEPEATGGYVGDPARIRQVLSNLLSNAVKFTRAGRITLTVSARPGPALTRLDFAVRDTGIGFDSAASERLFSRFEQLDGSITRSFGGSGLGLSISRALAEAMGGSLTAEGAPGEGATFTLTLELARARGQAAAVEAAEAAEAVQAPEPGRTPFEGLRVLLAEDHPVNRRVVELILGAAGADLTCVENGAEAVETAGRETFDLILMDMQMPVMDGLTAIAAIRAMEASGAGAPTPIHVLTANAMPEDISRSLSAGADGHISKPIEASRLLQKVAEAVQPGRPAVVGNAA